MLLLINNNIAKKLSHGILYSKVGI